MQKKKTKKTRRAYLERNEQHIDYLLKSFGTTPTRDTLGAGNLGRLGQGFESPIHSVGSLESLSPHRIGKSGKRKRKKK